MVDLQRELEDAARWLSRLATDGPDLTINAHKKAAHEANELAAEPSLEEIADVAICLVGVCVRNGWSSDDVAHAVRLKTAVNARRQWLQQADGTWQHVSAA